MIHLHLRAALGRSDAQTRAHFQHIHWHAPLFYMRKDGAWHQQMPACFIAVCIRLRGNGETPSVPREGEGLTKEVGQHLLRVLTFSSALKRKVHAEATLNESPDFRCSSDRQEVKLRVKTFTSHINNVWTKERTSHPFCWQSPAGHHNSSDPQQLSRAAVWQMCVSNNRCLSTCTRLPRSHAS